MCLFIMCDNMFCEPRKNQCGLIHGTIGKSRGGGLWGTRGSRPRNPRTIAPASCLLPAPGPRCYATCTQREEAEARSCPDPTAKPWPAMSYVRGDEEHLPLAPKSVDCEWRAASTGDGRVSAA